MNNIKNLTNKEFEYLKFWVNRWKAPYSEYQIQILKEFNFI
jgi:hypothetical protein